MPMSRRNYQAFADELERIRPTAEDTKQYQTWTQCVEAIASACKRDNARFNYERFYTACGYEPDSP